MYDNGSGYVIVKSSDITGFAYLADRNVSKHWWTGNLKNAMIFYSEYAAEQVCNKLKNDDNFWM